MLQPVVLEAIHMAHIGPMLQPLALIPQYSVLQIWYHRVFLPVEKALVLLDAGDQTKN